MTTEAQRGWLLTIAKNGGMISRLHIPVGQGGSISSLVKRGLAEWRNRSFLYITDIGRDEITDWELCAFCSEVTHIHESACIHCGRMKAWVCD
jgi:hypothetical protein